MNETYEIGYADAGPVVDLTQTLTVDQGARLRVVSATDGFVA